MHHQVSTGISMLIISVSAVQVLVHRFTITSILGLGTPTNGIADGFVVDHGLIILAFSEDFTYLVSLATFSEVSLLATPTGLGYGMAARGAAGWISDFNFLEEYYESEWEGYEQRRLDLRRPIDNRQWRLLTVCG